MAVQVVNLLPQLQTPHLQLHIQWHDAMFLVHETNVNMHTHVHLYDIVCTLYTLTQSVSLRWCIGLINISIILMSKQPAMFRVMH